MARFTRTYLARVTQTYTISEGDLCDLDRDVITAWMNDEHYNDGPVWDSDIDEIISQYTDDAEEIEAIDDWDLTIDVTGTL